MKEEKIEKKKTKPTSDLTDNLFFALGAASAIGLAMLWFKTKKQN